MKNGFRFGRDIEEFFDNEGWQTQIKEPWKLLSASRRVLIGQRDKLRVSPSVKVERNATLIGPVGIGPRSVVCNGSYIVGPVQIGSDSVIGPNCFVRPHSILGNRVRVGPGVELKNVLAGHGTEFHHYCVILDSVIGRECTISAGTVTLVVRYDMKPVRVRWRRHLVSTNRLKFGCVMGNRTVCAGNVVILPGKVIGRNCRIGFNATIDRNIEDNVMVRNKQELEVRPWSGVGRVPLPTRIPLEENHHEGA